MSVLKRVFIVVCCGLLGLGFVDLACGAEWQFYYQTEIEKDNVTRTEKLYYDKSSVVKPEKNIIRVTQKTTLAGYDEKEADSKLRLIEINCSSRKYRILSATEFESGTGKMLPEARYNDAPWTRFSLDSVIEGLYSNVCFEKKKPKVTEKKPDQQAGKDIEKGKDQ